MYVQTRSTSLMVLNYHVFLKALFKRDPLMAGTLNNLSELTDDVDESASLETNIDRFMEEAMLLEDKAMQTYHRARILKDYLAVDEGGFGLVAIMLLPCQTLH